MLSIGKMSVGQHAYYDELAKEDYYLEGGEPPGKWFGQGASALNLSGDVRSREFSDLFNSELLYLKLKITIACEIIEDL